jgi:hypothetical protein
MDSTNDAFAGTGGYIAILASLSSDLPFVETVDDASVDSDSTMILFRRFLLLLSINMQQSMPCKCLFNHWMWMPHKCLTSFLPHLDLYWNNTGMTDKYWQTPLSRMAGLTTFCCHWESVVEGYDLDYQIVHPAAIPHTWHEAETYSVCTNSTNLDSDPTVVPEL